MITTTVVLPNVSYRDAPKQVDFYHRLTERLRGLPGVDAVGLVSRMPLDFGNSLGFVIVGQPAPDPGRYPSASYRQTSTEYFHAMGIPLIRGRVFGNGDDVTLSVDGGGQSRACRGVLLGSGGGRPACRYQR